MDFCKVFDVGQPFDVPTYNPTLAPPLFHIFSPALALSDEDLNVWATSLSQRSFSVNNSGLVDGKRIELDQYAVWRSRAFLLDTIQATQFTILEADTNSNAMTVVPLALCEDKQVVKILVVVSDDSLMDSEYLSAWKLNPRLISWTTEISRFPNANARIKFATPYVAELIFAKPNKVTHVVINNIHCRKPDLIAFLEKMRGTSVKIVFIAPIFCRSLVHRLETYFGPVSKVSTSDRVLTTTLDYSRVLETFNFDQISLDETSLLPGPEALDENNVIRVTDAVLIADIAERCGIHAYYNKLVNQGKHVIVYLPTMELVNEVKHLLIERQGNDKKFVVTRMFGLDNLDSIRRIWKDSIIHVVLSTVGLHAHHGFKQVGYVVDSCLQSTSVYNKDGFKMEQTVASDMATVYHRMNDVPTKFYIPLVNAHQLGTIKTTDPLKCVGQPELENLLLHRTLYGQTINSINFFDKIPPKLDGDAIGCLIDSGFIGTDYKPTELGYLVGLLPGLEPDLALLVFQGFFWKSLEKAVILAAILKCLQTGKHLVKEKHMISKFIVPTFSSDHISLLAAYGIAMSDYQHRYENRYLKLYNVQLLGLIVNQITRIENMLQLSGFLRFPQRCSIPKYNQNKANHAVTQVMIVASMRRVLTRNSTTALPAFRTYNNFPVISLLEDELHDAKEEIAVYHRLNAGHDNVGSPITRCSKLMFAMFGMMAGGSRFNGLDRVDINAVGHKLGLQWKQSPKNMSAVYSFRYQYKAHFLSNLEAIQRGQEYATDDNIVIRSLEAIRLHDNKI